MDNGSLNRQEWRGRPHRKKPPKFPYWWMLLLAAAAVLQVTGLVQTLNDRAQSNAARQAAGELREIYRETAAAPASATMAPPAETRAIAAAETPESRPPRTEEPPASPAESPAPTPVPRLEEVRYPDHPEQKTSARFKALQRENRDIVGWLTVGNIVDEPVVQRDNVFYMDHDVRGNENVTGAIFLDEFVSLKTRPWGIILYGHNMRDGGMFGRLRNYEKSGYFRGNPVLTFNTAYEDGEYEIFAAGVVDVENDGSDRFLDLFGVMTRNIHEREAALETLKRITPYDTHVDVKPEDQLLLLVTCVGNDNERRVVAARRVNQ